MKNLGFTFAKMVICSGVIVPMAMASMPQEFRSRFSPFEFRENGVPFVIFDSSEIFQEPTRSEMARKSNDEISEDSQFLPVTDEDTIVSHDEIMGEKNLTQARPWRATDFKQQKEALGYEKNTFEVPKGLEVNVNFWKDIYAKYNSDQGVIHDSEYIDLIYEVVDFSSINAKGDLTIQQKMKMKKKLVKDAKNRAISLLEELSKVSDPKSLSNDKKKVWDYFQKIEGSDKYLAASKKNRLRFQLGQRDRMIQGIYFSGRYIEEFEKIFAEAGLPLELTRLPFVESSFNVLARSKVGASGLWQIMPYTTKGYWRRDASVDLRNHPIEATKLAAKLMKVNYSLLQSWPLALTGYNHGPNGVLRITKKYQSRDIAELVKQKAFGFASRNFYASFLAAIEVTNNAPKYFGNISWSETLNSMDIQAPRPVSYSELLKWFSKDDLKAQVYNPHLTKAARAGRPIPKGYVFSIPQSFYEVVAKDLHLSSSLASSADEDPANKKNLENKINSPAERQLEAPKVAKASSSPVRIPASERNQSAVINSQGEGQRDHLDSSAANQGSEKNVKKNNQKMMPSDSNKSAENLKDINQRSESDISKTAKTDSKKEARLESQQPQESTNPKSPDSKIEISESEKSIEKAQTYLVQKGDSLKKIAEQFGVTEKDLVNKNNLSKTNKLRAGKVIEIPHQASAANN